MSEKIFLRILKNAIHGEKFSESENLTMTQWDKIFSLAQTHRVLPLIYNCVYDSCSFDDSVAKKLHTHTKLLVSQQVLKTENFLNLYRTMSDAGTEPLVIKGILCRSLYPNPDFRISSDEDLLISEDEFQNCKNILISNGMQSACDDESGYQTSFLSESGLHIELHRSFFDSSLDYYTPWNKLFSKAFEKATYITIDSVKIKTLSCTENLLYLILHALKHFIHSGVGIRQICDIVLFANKYGCGIDWEYLLTKLKKLRAYKFAIGLFSIGEKHLGFDRAKAFFPAHISLDDAYSNYLLDDILCAGVFGSSTLSRKHSSGLTFSAAQGKKKSLLTRIFPPLRSLDNKYNYAKKCPLLLPVAWCHRLVRYKKEVSSTTQNDPRATINIGNQRIELLKKYELLPKSSLDYS